MATALCFKCGSRKKEATTMCGKCMSAPRTFDDLVLSFCLSLQCVTPDTLKKCREHFKVKKRPPGFRESIIELARPLAERYAIDSEQSIQYPPEMLEFTDLDDDDDVVKRRSVRVQIIGRHKGRGDDEPSEALGNKKKTCHMETWIVGKDITEEQVTQNVDGDQIYVWYRWMGNRWSWSCVTRGKFAQLKALEEGNPF